MSIGGAAYLAEADVLWQQHDSRTNVLVANGVTSVGTPNTGFSYTTLTSGAQFGFSVAISDDGLTLAVGSPQYNAYLDTADNSHVYYSGAFSVFTRPNTSSAWQPFPNNTSGTNIVYPAGAAVFSAAAGQATCGAFVADTFSNNVYNRASLGWAVALSGDASTLAVSAPCLGLAGTSLDTNSRGGVLIYTRTPSGYVSYTPTPLLQPSLVQTSNNFYGFSVAISAQAEIIAVADPAYNASNGTLPVGALWIYVRSTAAGGAYVPLYNYASIGSPFCSLAPGNTLAVYLGSAVSVSGVSNNASVAFTVVVGSAYALGQYTGNRGSPGGHFVLNVPQNVYQTVVSSGAPYPAVSLPSLSVVDATTSAFANAIAAFVNCTFPNNMHLGASVAISRDGSTIAVGAPTNNTANTTSSSPLICGLVLIFAVNSSTGLSLPSQVLYQPNYVSSANNVPVSPTGNNVLGFGASVALSADARTLVVGACDPTIYLTTNQVPAAQNYGYVFVYTLINGVYTQVSGTNYAYGYTFPYVKYSSAAVVTNFASFIGNALSAFGNATYHIQTGNSGTFANSLALSANGQVVALGLPQYSSTSPQLAPSNSGTYLGTGFQEGAVLTFLVRQAIAQILALEDEIGPACDNDYNDLVVRTGYNALQPLQNTAYTTGPLYFTLALDFLRLSSSNAVAVYIVLDEGLFTYASTANPYVGWSIAYFYEGSQVGSTLATGSLSAQHLAGLDLAANYGAGFTGAHAIQVYTNTAGCVPSAFQASPSAFYAAWNASQITPYAATAVLRAPIVANASTGLSPAVSASPPFALVFACTHADGSIGYVAPYALIEDPTNAQVIANEAATGVTTIQKVAVDNTEITTSTPNGTFQPTQEYVPLVDVYPGSPSDYGGDTAYKLATGSAALSFGNPTDLSLRLPPVGPSAAWTTTTANWVWVQATD